MTCTVVFQLYRLYAVLLNANNIRLLTKCDAALLSFRYTSILLKSCLCCCSLATLAPQQKGRTNSRNHHFLPECFAAFYQNALRLLPECIAPRTTRGCDTVVMASIFCVDCSWDRLVVIVCFDLPVKRCERDRAWLLITLASAFLVNAEFESLETLDD